MTNEEKIPLTAAEKHEQARAFALSGSLSKFQLAKQRKALENKLLAEKNLPIKASRPSVKNPKPASTYSYQTTTVTASTAAATPLTAVTTPIPPTISTAPPPLVAPRSDLPANTIPAEEPSPPPPDPPAASASTVVVGEDPKTWATVDYRDWQYVYVCNGPFEGRFGYYDDHQDGFALIYFGMPMVGDGPYQMALEDLRKPPPKYCENAFTAM